MKSKLLIADDDLNNLIALQAYFENEFELHFAINGLEAIESLKRVIPDLIILDWKMPMMDGMETIHFLKNHVKYRDIPVIVITGVHTHDTDFLIAYQNGVIDYIKKPFNIDELKHKVMGLLKLITTKNIDLKVKKEELMKSEFLNTNYDNTIQNFLKEIDLVMHQSNEHDTTKIEISKIKNKLVKNLDDLNLVITGDLKGLNNDFTKNLTFKHPNITNAEIKLCILIRMNLDSKEISNISHQTYDTVRVARTRLRKKLNLDKKDTLIGYLMRF